MIKNKKKSDKTSMPAPPKGFIDRFKQLSKISEQKKPELQIGQIWTTTNSSGPSRLVVITCDSSHSIDADMPDVGVCALNFNYPEIMKKNRQLLVLDFKDSDLAEEILIETWNPISILASQLLEYLCDISSTAKRRLIKLTSTPEYPEEFSSFCEICCAHTQNLAAPFRSLFDKKVIFKKQLDTKSIGSEKLQAHNLESDQQELSEVQLIKLSLSANEELSMAAADHAIICKHIKKFLKDNFSNITSIFDGTCLILSSTNKRPFQLDAGLPNNEIFVSDETGVLSLDQYDLEKIAELLQA